MADHSPQKPLSFTGRVHFQFREFLQSHMSTDEGGNQVFVGVVRGFFGTPPNGSSFEVQVKLSVGDRFSEDAYEVALPSALALLGARREVRQAAIDYVNTCMSSLVGPQWTSMTGLTATNNTFLIQGQMGFVDFETSGDTW